MSLWKMEWRAARQAKVEKQEWSSLKVGPEWKRLWSSLPGLLHEGDARIRTGGLSPLSSKLLPIFHTVDRHSEEA